MSEKVEKILAAWERERREILATGGSATPDSLSSGALGVPPEITNAEIERLIAVEEGVIDRADEPGYTAGLRFHDLPASVRRIALYREILRLRASLAAVSEERDAATKRLGILDEYLEDVHWNSFGPDPDKRVRLDWFVGDGGSEPFDTYGATFGAALDAAFEKFYPAALPVVEEPSE
jgi:hypothetical protein